MTGVADLVSRYEEAVKAAEEAVRKYDHLDFISTPRLVVETLWALGWRPAQRDGGDHENG